MADDELLRSLAGVVAADSGAPADPAGLPAQRFIYFSAAWCPDCAPVSPLVPAFCALKAGSGVPFALTYVAFDDSGESLSNNQYYIYFQATGASASPSV